MAFMCCYVVQRDPHIWGQIQNIGPRGKKVASECFYCPPIDNISSILILFLFLDCQALRLAFEMAKKVSLRLMH